MLQPANEAYRLAFGLDVRTLRLLRTINDRPGITATSLHKLTMVEKTLLSKDLKVLIEKRLVRRAIYPADARQYQLFATNEGEKIRIASDKLGHKIESELLAALSMTEQSQLDTILSKLLDSFQKDEKSDI